MSFRKLASVRRIDSITEIKNAERIEVATLGGWEVVVKKGDFKPGELVVYFEIDSWIPHEVAPFLTAVGKEPKEYKGIKGQRLKTVKLRGQVSQGLVLPLTLTAEEGEDLTEKLGVIKYDPVVDQVERNSEGRVRGTFPTHLFPKTEQERYQNLVGSNKLDKNDTYEVTLKLDGSSMTVYYYRGAYGVCSRNQELTWPRFKQSWWKRLLNFFVPSTKPDYLFPQTGNHFLDTAAKLYPLLSYLNGLNIAIQGELMGPGIQKNREKLPEHTFFVYDIWDIDAQEYYTAAERHALCEFLTLSHVPVLSLTANAPTMEQGLKLAERPSIVNPIAEGIVYKSLRDPSKSFKIINNKFLLAEE